MLTTRIGLNPAESGWNIGSFEMWGWSCRNWMIPSGMGIVTLGWPRRAASAGTARYAGL